jgi:hypothetical protein
LSALDDHLSTSVSRSRAWLLVPAAGLLLLVVPIVIGLLVRPSAPGQPSAARPAAPTPPAAPAFPDPPAGAVVFSRELGPDALALGVVPRPRSVVLQASVVDQLGNGARGLGVDFVVGGVRRSAAACGPGCYRAVASVRGRPAAVVVEVRGRGVAGRWRVALPAAWPPADGSELVAKADRVWRSLRSLSFSEKIASDPVHRVVSTWRVQAPDRVAYRIKGGWSGVIVGSSRWDRPPRGGRWVRSPQDPLTQPVPPWSSVADAHVLGTTSVRGRPAWRVSFFDRRSHAWFTMLVDRATLRTVDTRMVTTAHFMHDVYGSFDATPPVVPPG